MSRKIEELKKIKKIAKLGGGEDKIKSQHEKGKLTARERIDLLLDKGSFEEFDLFVRHQSTDFGLDKQRFYTDGVVNRDWENSWQDSLHIFSDFTILGGSLAEVSREEDL